MDFKDLPSWKKDNNSQAFKWYKLVSTNLRPAKYLIAQTIPIPKTYTTLAEDQLYQLLQEKTVLLLKQKHELQNTELKPPLHLTHPNLLDLIEYVSQQMLRSCEFCEWTCKVNRENGETGVCKLTSTSRVSSAFPHHGEENILRGIHGSGTIFFNSCNLRCVYCQNSDISTETVSGTIVSPQQLANIMINLRVKGCHNINLVGGDPIPHIHTIIAAIKLLTHHHVNHLTRSFHSSSTAYHYGTYINTPILWNSNLYLTSKALHLLIPLIDIWLPDFKYGNDQCARQYSKIPRYYQVLTRNLQVLYDLNEDVLIRHLLLPNHITCCTATILKWISHHTPSYPVNLMDQYYPSYKTNPRDSHFNEKYKSLSRTLTNQEINEALRLAEKYRIHYQGVSTLKYSSSARNV